MALMKHTAKIKLYNSYFDMNDRLSPKAILNIFQDVASIHGEEIGVGYIPMLEKNLYWVISRLKFDILKMPETNQVVVVETWPHEKGRIDFDRDMKITSEDGEVLIIATSKWCVIDTVKRALQRTENVTYNGECVSDKNYDDKFAKIILPEGELKHKFDYIVQFSDLDHNKHMNNTNYATLVANAITHKDIIHFEINFLHECLPGDVIAVSTIKNDDGEYVLGKVAENTVFSAFVR